MDCIISDGKRFTTRAVCPATDFEFVRDSAWDEISTLTVKRDKYDKDIEEGDIVTAGKYNGIIKKATPVNLTTKLDCEHIAKIFDRDIIYSERAIEGLEGWVKDQIDAEFTNQSDLYYRLPNLVVIAETDTVSDLEPDVNDDKWNIMRFLSKIRRVHDIRTTFEMKRESLIVRLRNVGTTLKKLDLSNPDVEVLEENHSNDLTAKLSVYIESLRETQNWYLLDDGTYTDNAMAPNRVNGKWRTVKAAKVREVAGTVADEFAKNDKSHKIRFSMPRSKARFSFYDNIQLATQGKLFFTHISAVRESKGSNRIEYQCGELKTKLTDKTKGDM